MRLTHSLRPLMAASLVLAFCGCSQMPAPKVGASAPTDAAAAGPHYLRGVSTPYSTPLAEVGDVELLGPESAMKDALLGGGQEFLVAATLFEQDDVMTLDLILLNQSGEPVRVAREDLFVVDAEGQWLNPISDWDEGKQYGLRARQARSAAALASNMPYYEMDYGSKALAYESMESFDPSSLNDKRTTAPTQTVVRPRNDRDFVYRGTDLNDPAPTQREVEVPANAGRAFWAYFEAKEPAFPLTAVVLVDGEQHLFRFDR